MLTWIATIGLVTACSLDVLTTSFILAHGGYEMNPVMVPVVTIPVLHMALKWLVILFILGVAAVTNRIVPQSGLLIIAVVFFWYAFVVVHNTFVLLSL